MPNLFDLMGLIEDGELRREIAIMRCVSLTNAVSETGNRVVGRLASWAKSVVNNERLDYRVVTVKDKIDGQLDQMKSLSRAELESRLRNELYVKCRDLNPGVVPEVMDGDSLSVWIIREAAKTFLLNDGMTVANLAEQVREKYQERLIARLHRLLVSQTATEARVQDQRLQAGLNGLSINLMRGLASQIKPQEFSGTGFGRTLRTENGTEKLTMLVKAMGFECFDILSLRSSVIYELTMKLNPMSRTFLADYVWMSLVQYPKAFTVRRDILPDYIAGSQKDALAEEQEFRLAITRRDEFGKRIKDARAELKKLQGQLDKLNEQYLAAARERDTARKAFRKLESERRQYDERLSVKTRDEIKQYYADVTKTSRDRDWAEENCSKIRQQMEALENQMQEKKGLLSVMEKQFFGLRKELDHTIALKMQRLSAQWRAFFFRFQMDPVIFGTLVTDFTRDDRLKLSEYLKEMHDSRNPDAYGMWTEEEEQDGVTTKYNGIRCRLDEKRYAKVLYKGTYIRKAWIE